MTQGTVSPSGTSTGQQARLTRELRGRPRLTIETSVIFEAVRCHSTVMATARELGRSDACIHVRFKEEGPTLGDLIRAIAVKAIRSP